MLLWETALNETPISPAMLGRDAPHRARGISVSRHVHRDRRRRGKEGGFDFYYHGGYNELKNSFTREYGDGGEVDNFFSHNATTRVKREWGEGPLLSRPPSGARSR